MPAPERLRSSVANVLSRQIRQNLLAVISLTVALIALSYNTWRNELTEQQRNQRHAAFRVVEHLSDLQSLSNAGAYGEQKGEEIFLGGWGHVISARQLARLLGEADRQAVADFQAVWSTHGELLTSSDPARRRAADEAITNSINAAFDQLIGTLNGLQ